MNQEKNVTKANERVQPPPKMNKKQKQPDVQSEKNQASQPEQPQIRQGQVENQEDRSQAGQRSPGNFQPESERKNFSDDKRNKDGIDTTRYPEIDTESYPEEEGPDPQEFTRKDNKSYDNDPKSDRV